MSFLSFIVPKDGCQYVVPTNLSHQQSQSSFLLPGALQTMKVAPLHCQINIIIRGINVVS